MKETIVKYIHLYIGCKILSPTGKIYTLNGVEHSYGKCLLILSLEDDPWQLIANASITTHNYKPILRLLTDISDEEAIFLINLSHSNHHDFKPASIRYKHHNLIGWHYSLWNFIEKQEAHYNCELSYQQLNPQQFCYLLSQSFDLFDLIPQGLAFYKIPL